MRTRTITLVFLSASAFACGGSSRDRSGETPPPTVSASERCEFGAGEWSTPVDGMRGRLVSSRVDETLQLTLELENISDEPREIYWYGRPDAGFASFALLDTDGVEVPEPGWQLGGNEHTGVLRTTIRPSAVVSHRVPIDVFERQDGMRIVRIGAFWGRELPPEESRAYLRARVNGGAPTGPETLVVEISDDGSVDVREPTTETLADLSDDGGVVEHVPVPSEPRGRAWTESLEIPPLCIQ